MLFSLSPFLLLGRALRGGAFLRPPRIGGVLPFGLIRTPPRGFLSGPGLLGLAG